MTFFLVFWGGGWEVGGEDPSLKFISVGFHSVNVFCHRSETSYFLLVSLFMCSTSNVEQC